MEVILFRHGIAEEKSKSGKDADRRLTGKGARRTEQAALGLARLVEKPRLLLTSPKTRAVETARIVGEVLERRARVMKALGRGSAEAIVAQIGKLKVEVVVLVGHEPVLGQMAGILCGLRSAGGPGAEGWGIELDKAGACGLEVTVAEGKVAGGKMKWLATAKMLRRVGR